MEFLLTIVLILIIGMMFQIRRLRTTIDILGSDLRDLARKFQRIHDERQPPPATDAKSAPAPAPTAAMPVELAEPTPVNPAPWVTPTPTTIELPPQPAPIPVAAPGPGSPLVQSVKDILRKIWQWIMVGEEYRPAGVSMEYAVATTWLMRAGIVAVVACVGYFLKWSIERQLVGPIGRVAISVITGLVMLISGLRLLGKRWNILGQGFIGGGLAVLYFALYATGPLYNLLPIAAVFGLMSLLTLVTGVIAVSISSLLVAILGIIGGFGTPVMLSTNEPHLPALFAYLFMLNVGILGIAHYRQWRLLNYLAFAGTWCLAGAAIHTHYDKMRDFNVTLAFLSLFFLIHATLVYIYNIRRALRSTMLEVTHLLLNAGIYSVASYYLVRDAVGRPYPALVTLALALYFVFQATLFLRKKLVDRPLIMALLGLAAFFAIISLPMIMEKESLTICWSLMALLLIWLSTRMESAFLRHGSYVMFAIVFIRLVTVDFSRDFSHLAAAATFADYLRQMLSRLWTFGAAIVALFLAFRIESHAAGKPRSGDAIVTPTNDMPAILPGAIAGACFFWGVLIIFFAFLQMEFYQMLAFYTPLRPGVLTMLWCGLAGFFLWHFLATNRKVPLVAIAFCAVVAITKSFIDMDEWRVAHDFCFHIDHSLGSVAMRWVDFASILAMLLAVGCLLFHRPHPEERTVARIFGYASLILLFVYLTLEINTLLFWHLKEFQGGGVSVFWTVFAFGMVAGGIWKKVAPLRYTGLLLFAVVIGKVFLSDLARMPIIFRVVAFLVLGILLLLGAFAYLYAGKQFRKEMQS